MIGRLFRNPRKAQYAIAVFVLLLIAAFATQCRAETLHAEAGSAIVRGETPAVGLSLHFPNGPADTSYECGLLLIGAADRSANNSAAYCMLVDGFRRLDAGLGLAALNHSDEFNTGTMQFALMLRYRITDRLALTWRHFSNAGQQQPNYGRDVLLVGWRF